MQRPFLRRTRNEIFGGGRSLGCEQICYYKCKPGLLLKLRKVSSSWKRIFRKQGLFIQMYCFEIYSTCTLSIFTCTLEANILLFNVESACNEWTVEWNLAEAPKSSWKLLDNSPQKPYHTFLLLVNKLGNTFIHTFIENIIFAVSIRQCAIPFPAKPRPI